jgi:asparagine synthase (glutamine-hydrolysing)
MCGIAGFFERRGHSDGDAEIRVNRMADTLSHRGPDDSGAWIDAAAGIALGHRRLSIIDLSPLGAQPMVSADDRYVISFNGEVYNFQDLRTELESLGHRFRGGSDTEVMLGACMQWGPEQAVRRFVGMFAFALWDRRDRSLRLVRDRLGVKPLYWSLRNDVLLFGSELKALMAHPTWQGEVDREALAAFVRHGYVPGPAAIFRGVHKLQPGTILTLRTGGEPKLEAYWSLHAVIDGGGDGAAIDEEEALDQLDAQLKEAVRIRMIADVPLGAFLSGGIDSSTIVALMQAQSNRPIRTFSVGFHEKGYDEAQYARSVASHLNTDHTELYVSPRDALDVVPRLPEWFDEPFADSSQIPTYLISRLTRPHVTVALSGDGGDELFAGYPRYRLIDSLWRRAQLLPAAVRRQIGAALRAVPPGVLDRVDGFLPRGLRVMNPGDKIHRVASTIGERSADAMFAELSAVYAGSATLVPGSCGRLNVNSILDAPATLTAFISRMQYHDSVSYLPDDILTKVDRCSMAVSLETRGPLLDQRLTEFVWSLPLKYKLRGGESKYLLRRLLYRYVPRQIVDRPKMGFSVPVGNWLRGPLRDWADALLTPRRLDTEGFFATADVRRLWLEHQSGRANRDNVLWHILMFQAWHERYRPTQRL